MNDDRKGPSDRIRPVGVPLPDHTLVPSEGGADSLARRLHETLAHLSRLALEDLPQGDLLATTTEAVRSTLGVDSAEVLRVTPEGELHFEGGSGWPEDPTAFRPRSCGESDSPAGLALATGGPILVTDFASEPRFREAEPYRAHGVASGLCVAITGPGGRPFGVIGVYSRTRREFAPEEVLFLVSVANLLAGATRHRLAEEDLRSSDRHKGEFLAQLGHELRNPLAAIRTACELIGRVDLAGPMRVQLQQTLDRQVRHLVRIVDDLLDLARISRNQIRLVEESFDLTALVRESAESIRATVGARRQTLHVSVPEGALRSWGDPARLTQAVGNLLANAVRFSPDGARIDLSLEAHGNDAIIRVRDNGSGIAPELLPWIFDLFRQGEHSGVRGPKEGLGIGLTLVKRIAELHAGTVEAHSGGVGCGSEFVVRLPLRGGPSATGKGPEAGDDSAPSARGTRVLIVDDNTDAARLLAALLETEGYEVHIAFEGHSGLREIASFTPRVVLLDIGMPGLNGYQVAKRLRQRMGESCPLLVALTGYGQDEDKARSAAAGFDHHLVKPVDPLLLSRILAEANRT